MGQAEHPACLLRWHTSDQLAPANSHKNPRPRPGAPGAPPAVSGARQGGPGGGVPAPPAPSPALPHVSGAPGAAAMELPAVSLKAIILVHWLLTVWGCMNYMLPLSYAWGNFSVLAVGIWAIVQRDSLDAITMFLTGLLLTVLTDIIHISIFYPSHDFLSDVKRFSIGMAIFSLLLKPVSCYLVYRMYRERGGEYTLNIGVSSAGQDRSTYEPIDQPEASPQWPSSSKAAQPY